MKPTTGTKHDTGRQRGGSDLGRPTGWGGVKRRGRAAHAVGAGISHRSIGVKDTKGEGAILIMAIGDDFCRPSDALLRP